MKLRICDLEPGDVLEVRGYISLSSGGFLYRGSLVAVISSQEGTKQVLVLHSAAPQRPPPKAVVEGTVYDLYTQNRGYGDNIQTLYERLENGSLLSG